MTGDPPHMLYAHSANQTGSRQPLVEHIRNVANLAADMAEPFGGRELAFLAGLWHDVGKADPAWQNRLIECEQGLHERVGIDHKCAGALLAELTGGTAGLAGLLIHGHHGGLANPKSDYPRWLQEKRQLPGPHRAIEELKKVMPDLTDQVAPGVPPNARKDPLAAEMFLRMTYSALIDADSLDTEAHQHGGTSQRSTENAPQLSELWDRYLSFLNTQPKPAPSTVNTVREEVHEDCLKAAAGPQGIFRLTVPTGGGKTRSAMAFALQHGTLYGLQRIIIAVPFNTITQQTARVYRDIFEAGSTGDGITVLEHHSAATEAQDDDSFGPAEVWRRLASENWDAPIVVTTTVQLFESLFSNQRTKTRKLHNLARSVIILDEVQALPKELLSPILDGIRLLTEDYGASVVLSTATQPTFELVKEFQDTGAKEINTRSNRHFDVLQRVKWDWRTEESNSWSEVARWVRNERSALVVVNTKRHAMELMDELQDEDVLHLSTLLCGRHRMEVITEVRRRLSTGEPCRLVSTQVVEAGVDLDFPTVFRAEAPLDSIIQAAGRCNREGLRAEGRVVVFRPPDDASPSGTYRSGRDVARVVRQLPGFNPNDPETVREYFTLLFDTAVDPDRNGIQKLRKNLDFPKVRERFRMIQEDTYDVVVEYPEEDSERIRWALERLRRKAGNPRHITRQLQQNMVTMHQREARRLQNQGLMETIMPGLGVWHGKYDPVRGIVEAGPDLIV